MWLQVSVPRALLSHALCKRPAKPQPRQRCPQGLFASLRLRAIWVRQHFPSVRTPGSVFVLKETLAVTTMIIADDQLVTISNSSDLAQAPRQGDSHFSYLEGKGPHRSQRPCPAWGQLAEGGLRRLPQPPRTRFLMVLPHGMLPPDMTAEACRASMPSVGTPGPLPPSTVSRGP